MQITSGLVIAVCSFITLLIYFTGAIAGAVMFIIKRIEDSEERILSDVNTKHSENNLRVVAMEKLVIRHDLLLNPEFANGRAHVHR